MSLSSFSDLSIASTIHNNRNRWMEMALSFEEHLGCPKEIVVVDDGSREIPSIGGLKSPLRVIRNENPTGFCAASARALSEVQTPYALLIDADITFLPGNFQAAYDAFRTTPKMAWCNLGQVDRNGKEGSSFERVIAPAWCFALGNQATRRWESRHASAASPAKSGSIENVTIAHSSSAFVRMNAYRAVNGFDLRYWQCQSDNDLCMRFLKGGWQVGVYHDYKVIHDGIGGKTGGMSRVYDLYRSRLMFYETHRPASRYYLRPILALRHLIEAVALSLKSSQGKADHLNPLWRASLAIKALLGYPSMRPKR